MRGSGSPSGVQNAQRQKAAPLGTHRDSELGSSTKGLILGGPGLCSSTLFSACASSSEQGLAAQAPPKSNLLGGPPASTHGGFSLQQLSVLPRQRQGQVQPF